jgi:hypothetical protein
LTAAGSQGISICLLFPGTFAKKPSRTDSQTELARENCCFFSMGLFSSRIFMRKIARARPTGRGAFGWFHL